MPKSLYVYYVERIISW